MHLYFSRDGVPHTAPFPLGFATVTHTARTMEVQGEEEVTSWLARRTRDDVKEEEVVEINLDANLCPC